MNFDIDKNKLDRAVSIEKRIHPNWERFQYVCDRLPEGHILKDHPFVGQYQYFIKSKLGKISIIELPNYFMDNITLWESCSSGTFFSGCKRYISLEEAIEEAKQYLRGDKKPEE